MNTIFIGVAGGTGSGKTTLTEHLAERFGSNISVVHPCVSCAVPCGTWRSVAARWSRW